MKHIDKFIFLIVVLLLSWLFHRNVINEFPSFVHAWSQSDHYALAIGFLKNHFDFFHPVTYNLNPQFPGNFQQVNASGITPADFPIHHFVAALIMKISGGANPWCFRLYVLFYSIVGLFFLYKLSYLQIKQRALSIFVVIFASTSPVFVYYQAGFIPSIPSLSNLFIALYFYFKNRESNRIKDFFLSILFFTLAALSRTPFSIFLIAMAGQELWYFIKYRKFNTTKLLSIAFSFLAIGSYFLYNTYLRHKYGSIFLSQPIPPESLHDFFIQLKQVFKNWGFQYFSTSQLLFLIIGLIYKTYRIFKRQNILKESYSLLLYAGIAFSGAFFYFILMIKQFPAHDYYFLDTFFPVIVLLTIWLLTGIPSIKNRFIFPAYLVLLLFISGFVFNSSKIQKERRQTGFWDRIQITSENFTNSKILLDSMGIEKDAKILVIDAYTPNIPFILMDRKGYAVLTSSKTNIQKALSWDYDYIAIQDGFLITEVINAYPDIIKLIERIGGNGKISIYIKREKPKKTNISDFLQLNMNKSLLTKIINFDSIPGECWMHTDSVYNEITKSRTGILTPNEEFGLTLSLTNKNNKIIKPSKVFFEGKFLFTGEVHQLYLVVSQKNTNLNYYMQIEVKPDTKNRNDWQDISLLITPLPRIDITEAELAIYLWNMGRNTIFYDNISISLF